jgi:DNA-binding GntR family transcriptional regulator
MTKKTQHEKAYDAILEKIIEGSYTPGMPLREVKVAKECGISPTPVREAFRRLKLEGWVDSEPYCGCCVKKFSFKELREIFMLREVLEAFAAREAAGNATKEDLEDMKDALDKEDEFIESLSHLEDDDRVTHPTETEIHFHRALIQASHIDIIKEKLDIVKLQINSIGHIPDHKFTIKEIKCYQQQHRMIYEAVKLGWEKTAETLLKEHLSNARIQLEKIYFIEN